MNAICRAELRMIDRLDLPSCLIRVGFLIGLLAVPGIAGADTVFLKNGQSFEGVILSQDETVVVLDTMVSGIRASGLRLKMAEIDRIETGDVAEGFFTAEPAPPALSPNAVQVEDRSGLYLTVPIMGELGTDAVAEGVMRAIAYAKRHRVPSLVFIVDSTGGDLDEVLMINRAMRTEHRPITFHAIIKRCQGAALAIPLMCDTVHVLPGALVGDTPTELGQGSRKYGNEDEQVLRTELARRAYEYAVSQGAPGLVVRAMIDPLEELAAWKEPGGELGLAATLPTDVPAEDAIFVTRAGEMLILKYDQLVALGLPTLTGGAEDLGEALEINNWQKESDYGEATMAELSGIRRKQLASNDTRFQDELKSNLVKRETTQALIENSVKQARDWDPTNGDYTTYAKRYGWGGWGRGNRRDIDYAPGTTMTRDSRDEWQRRSDLTMGYLRKAAKACNAMKSYDKEAVTLGMEPTYEEGELDRMIQDLQVKYDFVQEQRNRRGL